MNNPRSISVYLGALTLVALGGLSVLGVLSFRNLVELDTVVTEANEIGMAVRRQKDADMMHDAINSDVLAAQLAALNGEVGKGDEIAKELAEHIDRFEENLRENAAARLPAAALAQAKEIKPLLERYATSGREVVKLAFSDAAAAKDKAAAFENDFEALEGEMEKLADLIQARASEIEVQSEATLKRSLWQIGALFALTLVLTVGVCLYVNRTVRSSLDGLSSTAAEIARSGNLTLRARPSGIDEIERTIRAFNALIESLQGIVREVRAGSERILTAGDDLARDADATVHSAAESNEAANSIAQSIEALSASIAEMAEHAASAATATRQAGAQANDGEQVVDRAVEEMRQIANAVRSSGAAIDALGGSAQQISQIVNVIKEIADQTNLLALNAAIEAARAGEQGRGFAVVADEVRKLAERTTSSTVEISSMIEGIQRETQNAVAGMSSGVARVEQGVSLAGEAGQSMERVVVSARDSEAAMNAMASGLDEQQRSGREIADNAERVTRIADQSRAAAQHAAKRADELKGLARALDEAVRRFVT